MTDVFGREGARPTVGCDAVIFDVRKGELRVLLIKRGHEPFLGKWALPGGFMEWGESCETAAARELQEETGLTGVRLEQLGVFSEPGRDPRGTIVSVAYFGLVDDNNLAIKAADDAAEAQWFEVEKCPELAFDHTLILKKALDYMRNKKRL